jgi:hypothetical protein
VRWAHGRTAKLVLPGVLAAFTGTLDREQKLIAGRLCAGPDSMIASLTAAHWHGLTVDEDGVVRLLVPFSQAARRSGFVVIRRTRRMDPRPWTRGPLVICSPPRALADAAREMKDRRAVDAMVIGAVQRRLVRLDDVRSEVEAGPRHGSARARAALAKAETGAWSTPEYDLLKILSRSPVLPRIWPNPYLETRDGLRLPTPDGWIDDVGLALQVHSRRYHLRDEDWELTVEGDSRLTEAGLPVLAVTPASLSRDPQAYRNRVERTYLELRRTGRRPDVVMRPRGAGLVGASMGASNVK